MASVGRTVFQALLAPSEAARSVRQDEPFAACVVVLGLVAVGSAVNELLVCRAAAGFGASLGFVVWASIVNAAALAVMSATALALVSFFVHLLGGRARIGQLAWLIPLGFAPWMFAAPMGLVAAAIGGGLGVALVMPGYAVLFFWSVGTLAAMVAAACEVDLLRGLLAVAMAAGAAVVFLWAASVTTALSWFNAMVAVSPPVG